MGGLVVLFRHEPQEEGFTIVEMMIATSVLSVILLFCSVMIINIGNLYNKGINQARIQDTARTISDDVSQILELTKDGLTADTNVDIHTYCIGTIRYTYRLNAKLGTDSYAPGAPEAKHILWRDNISSGEPCTAHSLIEFNGIATNFSDGTDGTELMTSNSRLTEFTITPDSPYNISVGVAYGDSDLLSGSGLGTVCKSGPGQQFCATARQSSTITRRIN